MKSVCVVVVYTCRNVIICEIIVLMLVIAPKKTDRPTCSSLRGLYSLKPTWIVYGKMSGSIMSSVCLLMTSNRLNTSWRSLKLSDVIQNYTVFLVLEISRRKAPEGCWYAACNYSLARVYRGLCRLVCIAEWKRVTTNTNCLHPQGKKNQHPK